MQEKKYKLVGDPVIEIVNGEQVETYHIMALSTFKNLATNEIIKEGDLGGRISKGSLSQDGTCWISEDSVFASTDENVRIMDNAYINSSEISGNVFVSGNAIINDSVLSNVRENYMEISENARIVSSTLTGNVKVTNKAEIGYSFVGGQVIIDGQSTLEKCKVKNISVKPDDFITIRMFGEKLEDYTIHDKEINGKDLIVNAPQK